MVETIIISIGSLDIDNILRLEEGKQSTLPYKKIYGKVTPTPESSNYVVDAEQRQLTCKLSFQQKTRLQLLEKESKWHNMVNGDETDSVWIERIQYSYHGENDLDYPWETTIDLLVK